MGSIFLSGLRDQNFGKMGLKDQNNGKKIGINGRVPDSNGPSLKDRQAHGKNVTNSSDFLELL